MGYRAEAVLRQQCPACQSDPGLSPGRCCVGEPQDADTLLVSRVLGGPSVTEGSPQLKKLLFCFCFCFYHFKYESPLLFLSCFHSGCERKQDQLTLLLEHESVFSSAALLPPAMLRRLEGRSEIEGPQKEVGALSFICVTISGVQVSVPHR